MNQEFPWTQSQFAERLTSAVSDYWRGRSKQARKQKKSGKKDSGTRGEVTGGQHLNAFGDLLVEVIKATGLSDDFIFFRKPLVLPGYYRAQKKWDIVVAKENHLLAAIELKSQSGSFGNNLNNRAEEVLGLAKDFWTAYREKTFGLTPQPWLGYFFLLEDSIKSRAPVELATSSFPARKEFEGASYLDRYGILCERLVLERDYSATTFLVSPRASVVGSFQEPKPGLSVYRFAASLFAHLSGRVDL